jgi:NTE family protein
MTSVDDGDGAARVAVVLTGAAARGAFQAGALAELVPALEAQGLRPTIWLGTSAGAINAALWTASAHRGAAGASEALLGVWRRMSDDDVYRPLLPFTLARRGLAFAAGAVLGVGPGVPSALDTGPLARTADHELDVDQMAANVRDGVVEALGVVATRMPADDDAEVVGAASGRSVLFLDEQVVSGYAGDPGAALDVARGPISPAQVVASSAIPVAFPAVRVDAPAAAAGWYLDGGVRLNAPLHPAVGLGAGRIVLVSATATTYGPPPKPVPVGGRPDVDDAAAQVLHAVLADRTVEDLAMLRRTNRMVAQARTLTHGLAGPGAAPLRRADGTAYRQIPVLAVSPPPGAMGALAARIHAERTDRLGWLREQDNWLIGRALRGGGDAVGRRELLSYLFFDEAYFAASIELGREAARQALAAGWVQ